MHHSLPVSLSLLLPLLALLPTPTLTQSTPLPPLYIGTLQRCTPGRYPSDYAAWSVSSRPCTRKNPTSDASITLIGTYPLSGAGCGLGPFTVAGYDNVTFEGCTGPGQPYPTSVLRDGVKELECRPVRKEKETRLCEGGTCGPRGLKAELKTVLRCRRIRGEEHEDEEESD